MIEKKKRYATYYDKKIHPKRLNKKCKNCNITFNSDYKKKKYCSNECFKEYYKKYLLNWNQKNKNMMINWRKEFRLKNKEKIYNYHKERVKKDENYRLRCYLSQWCSSLIKKHKGIKKTKTEELLGCSFNEFKEYISKKFEPGMNWNNHTYHGWHLDHIIPCCSFDLSKKEEQQKCFHYTNFQPLWWYDNLKKSDKLTVNCYV